MSDKEPNTQMTGESLDISERRRQELKQLFPSVFTETNNSDGEVIETIDFEKLKAELGSFSDVYEGKRERYGMEWPGKRDCMKLIQQPSRATLKPCREESVDFDSTENLFIEGDNLEVLKLLQKSYYGKVKMIYIDPPYNTGKEFIYPDNYSESLETYMAYAGLVDDEGKKFSTNTATEGRFHTKWLNMMYPRLYLARNLLSEDGVIFISIDDNEVENLRRMCDEIFGEENLINPIVHNKLNSKNDTVNVQRNHEYILCYRKEITFITSTKIKPSLEKKILESDEVFKDGERYYLIKDPITTRGDGGTLNKRKNLGYTVYFNPSSKDFVAVQDYDIELAQISNTEDEIYTDDEGLVSRGYVKIRPPKVRGKLGAWTWGINNFNENKDEILIKETQNGYAVRKRVFVPSVDVIEKEGRYYIEHEKISNSRSIIEYSTNEGSTQLSEVLGKEAVFDNPKNIHLIQYLINLISEKDFIFLDFFAGSASSIHALMQQNIIDHGMRKFIAIQLPEYIEKESDAYKFGYKTIAEIAKERIRCAAQKIREQNESQLDLEDNADLDLGFKVLKLDKSNFKQWQSPSSEINAKQLGEQLELHTDHIDPYATQEEILYELLIKAGFVPTSKIDTLDLADKSVFSIDEGALLICLEDELTAELFDAVAELEPMQFICLDKGFVGNDQLKANAVQTFKSRAQNAEAEMVFKVV